MMNDEKRPQEERPDPALVFETLNAFHRTEALRGAIELGLFTAIAGERVSLKDLAKRIAGDERGTRILADYLSIMGFLNKSEIGYALTLNSKLFLDKESPAYLGGAVEFLSSDTLVSAFRNVANTVRHGRTQLPNEGTTTEEHPVWIQFAESMGPMMRQSAMTVAEMTPVPESMPLRVLDVATGHGEWGFAFARRFPESTVYALDWAPVLEYTKRQAKAQGLEKQIKLVPGDAFSIDLPSDLDLVLVPNFLHHFDKEECISFLTRVRGSLKKGGSVVIAEFIPNDDRVSPPGPASFAFVMLCTTPQGEAYTFAEINDMVLAAGFSDPKMEPLTNGMNTIVRARAQEVR